MEKNTSDELNILKNLLLRSRSVFSWVYGEDGELQETNCETLTMHTMFRYSGGLDSALEGFREQVSPQLLDFHFGVLWGAVREDTENGFRMHVIGPCLAGEVAANIIEEIAVANLSDTTLRNGFIAMYERLPVVSPILFQNDLLTLNLCVRGEKLTTSDIRQQSRNITQSIDVPQQDRYAPYMAEKAILNCIREGDLNYRGALAHWKECASEIHAATKSPFERAVLSASGFITLCTRAAIEGGLSPDVACTVGDGYVQAVLGCQTVEEIHAVNDMTVEDFVQRVHRSRLNHSWSRTVRDCVEYIELHPEDELSIHSLADRFGYTDYYLSHKFKAEVGESLNSYINVVRVERARFLLEMTRQTVTEIAEELRFCSPNYFSDTFRSIVGKSPVAYRREKQQIQV